MLKNGFNEKFIVLIFYIFNNINLYMNYNE